MASRVEIGGSGWQVRGRAAIVAALVAVLMCGWPLSTAAAKSHGGGGHHGGGHHSGGHHSGGHHSGGHHAATHHHAPKRHAPARHKAPPKHKAPAHHKSSSHAKKPAHHKKPGQHSSAAHKKPGAKKPAAKKKPVVHKKPAAKKPAPKKKPTAAKKPASKKAAPKKSPSKQSPKKPPTKPGTGKTHPKHPPSKPATANVNKNINVNKNVNVNKHIYERHGYWHPHHWHHGWHTWHWYASGAVFHSGYAWAESASSAFDGHVAALEQTVAALRAGNSLSAEQLASARREIASTHAVLANALAESRATNKKLSTIEDQLLASQSTSSEVGKAQSLVNRLRREVDRHMHRVLGLPPHPTPPSENDYAQETSRLTEQQKETLAADTAFQESVQKLVEANEKLVAAKRGLFEKDGKWKAARDGGRRTLALPQTGDVAADAEATIEAAQAAVVKLRGGKSAGG